MVCGRLVDGLLLVELSEGLELAIHKACVQGRIVLLQPSQGEAVVQSSLGRERAWFWQVWLPLHGAQITPKGDGVFLPLVHGRCDIVDDGFHGFCGSPDHNNRQEEQCPCGRRRGGSALASHQACMPVGKREIWVRDSV